MPGTANDVCTDGELPSEYEAEKDDCDDTDEFISPEGKELPDDAIDQDCDGEDWNASDDNGIFVDGDAGRRFANRRAPWTTRSKP